MAAMLDVRAHEAAASDLNHREFLELILQDELLVRNNRLVSRRIAAAGFRETRTHNEFNFALNPPVKKAKIFDLATGRFRPSSMNCKNCAAICVARSSPPRRRPAMRATNTTRLSAV